MTAPELSPTEAIVARYFEAGEPAPESYRSDGEVCECGHSDFDHAPDLAGPCVVEGDQTFGLYADDCMKFRPAVVQQHRSEPDCPCGPTQHPSGAWDHR